MEDEINLRGLIEILLRGWKIITAVTVLSVMVAGVFSFYIAKPSYVAKTVLMASYATDKLSSSNSNSDDLEGILNSISMYPSMTIETYKEQLKSPEVLQSTIDELNLQDKGINVEGLENLISLETISETNLIAIKVTHSDPVLAAEIANTLASRFTDFVTDMAKERASKSSEFLEEQLKKEKLKLDEAFFERKQFLSQPRGIDELTDEVSSMLSMLTSYKTQIVQKEVERSKLTAGIQATEEEMSRTPEILTIRKTIDNDLLMNQIVAESTGISISDASVISMESEEINENYLTLKLKAADFRILKAEIDSEIKELGTRINDYQTELERSQQELADKSYEKTLIDNKIRIAQEAYDAFLQKYEESMIAESTKIGESSIDLVSKAIVPVSPVGPRKMLNLAIGVVLGIMIGVFITFFRAYWKATSKPQ